MKRYDFNPDPRMSPTVGLLHAAVTYNYERLKRLVAGLNQTDIDYRGPQNDMNSIAQLLWHLAVVDLHWVYRLQSRQVPPELEARYGPMTDAEGRLPIVRGIPLETLLDEYDYVQDRLREICLGLRDDDLERFVPFENGHQAAIRWAIWHVADHSRHHYANIAHLTKCLRERNAP